MNGYCLADDFICPRISPQTSSSQSLEFAVAAVVFHANLHLPFSLVIPEGDLRPHLPFLLVIPEGDLRPHLPFLLVIPEGGSASALAFPACHPRRGSAFVFHAKHVKPPSVGKLAQL
jgi:hypothetical protein